MRKENLKRLTSYKIKSYHGYYLEHTNRVKAIRYAIDKYATGKLLDIGCGNKPYKELLEGKVISYIGCDIIQSSNNCVDILCEANKIPLQNEGFETVFSTQTLEHVGDCQGLVNEAYRLLKSKGYFIVSAPMYWPLHEEPYDFYRFTKHGFSYLLSNAGFEVIEIIPNGGKWALLGQAIMHTLPKWFLLPKIVKISINKTFEFLDKKYFDPSSTINYVAIGRKK